MEGIIIKLIGGIYTVKDLSSGEKFSCVARGKLRATKVDKHSSFNQSTTSKSKLETKTIKLSPKVGDYVTYILSETNYIDEIKPRRNELVRPDCANVDQILLVFSALMPEFNYTLLDRFLTVVENANINTKIIITKIDLMNDKELKDLKKNLEYYEKFYEIYYTSSKFDCGINEIKSLFKDKISVLSGQTGVGKSSILNALNEELNLDTQEISLALGRGKHTTRCTEIYEFLDGMIADTPGFSSIELSNMDEVEIKNSFIDFTDVNCKYKGCMHLNEPDCDIKRKYENGQILKTRYESYKKFIEEYRNKKLKY